MQKPVVILGESGMLGGYLSLYFTERGVACVAPPRFDAAQITREELVQLLKPLGARAVINCIGAIRQRDVSEGEMQAVNAEFPHRLAAACSEREVPLIHISTDCVFSGARGNYSESDIPDATDAYGRSKAAGELADASVIRTSLIGSERRNKRSLLEWVKTRAGQDVDGYANQLWNGVTCLQLAQFLESVISKGEYWQGVRHYFSLSAVSKYELVSLISEAYHLDVRVRKVDAKDARDLTLASEYTLAPSPDIRQQLIEMAVFDKARGLA